MDELLANNLFIGFVKIIGVDNKEKRVIVYKNDNNYYDMKYVFSKVDLNPNNKNYYLDKPFYNNFSGYTEQIDVNSLENYYTDGRIVFSIYDLHLEIDNDINLNQISKNKTR